MTELTSEPEYRYTRTVLKECAVAGVSFHVDHTDDLWQELEEGTKIALVRDRNNKHDRNAVAVMLAADYDPSHIDLDFIIGYIPRNENHEIAVMMDAGYGDKLEAEITTLRRGGNINNRIRITIWLTSREAQKIRPSTLHAESIDHCEFYHLITSLNQEGYIYERWGGTDQADFENLPIKGEPVLFINKSGSFVWFYLMKVVATGEDCAPFFNNPNDIDAIDDCSPFILTNIAGPISVATSEIDFISLGQLYHFSAKNFLSKEMSEKFLILINNKIGFSRRGVNIDSDPSIDENITNELTIDNLPLP